MNTRSFFKSLALLMGGAAVSPGIFIPKFEPVKWKIQQSLRFIPNPAWKDAEPIGFIVSPYFARAYYGTWYFEDWSDVVVPRANNGLLGKRIRAA